MTSPLHFATAKRRYCPICNSPLDYDNHYCTNPKCDGHNSVYAQVIAKQKTDRNDKFNPGDKSDD